MPRPAASATTWLILVRDVTGSVRVAGESQLTAGIVLELETGLLRGAGVARDGPEVLRQILGTAVSAPPGDLLPATPARVATTRELAPQLVATIATVPALSSIPVVEIEAPAEAEDLLDSLIGHLAGRDQPRDPPSGEDFALVYGQALRFLRAEPWARWHDAVDLVVELEIGRSTRVRAAVVMGNAGLQHGLVLYPDGEAPDGLEDWEPGEPVPAPPGTLLFTLDPPGELPEETRSKARRYGWPEGAALVPAIWRYEGPGDGRRPEGSEPDRDDAQQLALALAAVLAHDARGPVVAGAANEVTRGELILAGGVLARFAVRQRPPAEDPDAMSLAIHRLEHDLVPPGTTVVLGHLPWSSLPSLRNAARLHRPFPPGSPAPAGTQVPLVAVLLDERLGDATAAKAAQLDPFGVSIVVAEDRVAVVSLVGARGAEVLMELPSSAEAVRDFRRRMRSTKGLHVVLVADEASSTGEGPVFGLFECHLPLAPQAPRSQASGAAARRAQPSPRRRR